MRGAEGVVNFSATQRLLDAGARTLSASERAMNIENRARRDAETSDELIVGIIPYDLLSSVGLLVTPIDQRSECLVRMSLVSVVKPTGGDLLLLVNRVDLEVNRSYLVDLFASLSRSIMEAKARLDPSQRGSSLWAGDELRLANLGESMSRNDRIALPVLDVLRREGRPWAGHT